MTIWNESQNSELLINTRERETERESVCVCVCASMFMAKERAKLMKWNSVREEEVAGVSVAYNM